MTIDSHTTLLIDPHEPPAIQKAAQDLAADMTKVFGTAPHMAHRPSEATATLICIAFTANLPGTMVKPSGWEVLRIQDVVNPRLAGLAGEASCWC